jgi:hypothetical protein
MNEASISCFSLGKEEISMAYVPAVQGSAHHFLQAQNKAAAINENKAMFYKGLRKG